MKCKDCQDKQYCIDCKEEQQVIKIETKSSHKSKIPVCIKGNTLRFKGRTFTISKTELRNPNKKITTKEGFIFYIREKDKQLVLIKVKVNKSKNGKPNFCERCYDLLIGRDIPPKLSQDLNW